MEFYSKIGNLLTESYILDQLLAAGDNGTTLQIITDHWKTNCDNYNRAFKLSRSTFGRHVDNLRQLGFNIEYDFRACRYYVHDAKETLANPVMEKMVNCLRDFHFVDRFRTLGTAIIPREYAGGRHHLFNIACAMESHCKISIDYAPYDRPSYHAILHPYCLRESNSRWYLIAYKEGNTHNAPTQNFALDRIRKVSMLTDPFTIPQGLSLAERFHDSYGAWFDENIPVETVELLADERAADYLSSLPLHHSQTVPIRHGGRFYFKLRLRITPDFVNEIQRWGTCLEVKSPQHLRDELKERFLSALKHYADLDDNGQPKPVE